MDENKKNKSGSNQYIFYSVLALIVMCFSYLFLADGTNVNVDEMLKHISTGDAPF